ncbi:ABC transporter ATP-binding protein [Ornithinimicrobium murale]|uniref:ABC transporter ATP-binding protein n=1 Tax=Ornithinimicrobium murale TaxID=1050153 RepID=UPI0013B3B195|nr:ABC transporter ATP-binding protein [Ornithinimicrobium murale]
MEVAGLYKSFVLGRNRERVDVLRDISFDVGSGEFLTLLGPSGSGKSTLLRCIAGLESPDDGVIRIGDESVADKRRFVPPNRRDIGMVFQSYAVWPHMTVSQNVAYPLLNARARSTRRSSMNVDRDVNRTLETVGLGGYGGRGVHELSGGQQQRVALARAIISRSGLLLLDEPLSNLDSKLRREMRHELRQISKEHGLTSIYVTHDQFEALSMSDRILLMRDGRIEQQGEPEAIYGSPDTEFVAGFLGNINLIPARVLERHGSVVIAELSGTGETVRVAIPRNKELNVGEKATLGIRTHDITIQEAAEGGDSSIRDEGAPHDNRLTGRVTSLQFLGERWEVHVQVGDQEVRLFRYRNPDSSEGHLVNVAFAPERAFIFQDRDAPHGAATEPLPPSSTEKRQ